MFVQLPEFSVVRRQWSVVTLASGELSVVSRPLGHVPEDSVQMTEGGGQKTKGGDRCAGAQG